MSTTHLGRTGPYPEQYDPDLLQAVPRAIGRRELGLGTGLPFWGEDRWTAYELSWLDDQGKPNAAVADLVFPADSPNFLESKSVKLYLNSLNAHRIPGGREAVLGLLREDLGSTCGAPVQVGLHLASEWREIAVAEPDGEDLDTTALTHLDGQVSPDALAARGDTVRETLRTRLFRSVCPVTGQPDWADVQITYRGPQMDRSGLWRYLISYRNHAGFHENCVERIFMDVLQGCGPRELTVAARFLRRGGIDINPWRSNAAARPNVPGRAPRQ